MLHSKENPPNGFYVYAYLRIDNTPYYIGKGSKRRAWVKSKGEVSPPRDKSRIVILEHNLTDIGALALERFYIRWYGRKDIATGILRNKTDGGDGACGYHGPRKSPSPESIARAKSTRAGRTYVAWNKGQPMPEETKKKLTGQKRTDETRLKIKLARSKQIPTKRSDEIKQKMSLAALLRWEKHRQQKEKQ